MTIRNRFHGTTPVGRWLGTTGGVRLIHPGSITIFAAESNTATIPSVNVANSVIIYGGHTTNDAGTTRPVTTARVTLTNSTTVTATNGLNSGTQIVRFTVIEFEPGVLKSVQRGTITVGVSSTATATIAAVDPQKAAVWFLGFTIAAFTTNDLVYPRLDLTDGTTVTATVALAGGSTVVGYQVVEFN